MWKEFFQLCADHKQQTTRECLLGKGCGASTGGCLNSGGFLERIWPFSQEKITAYLLDYDECKQQLILIDDNTKTVKDVNKK